MRAASEPSASRRGVLVAAGRLSIAEPIGTAVAALTDPMQAVAAPVDAQAAV
jgi:hypothetical protein